MNTDYNWKPKLSSEVEINIVDDKYIINQLNYGYQVRVDKSMADILELMNGENSIYEILNFTGNKDLLFKKEFYKFLESEFIDKGIIISEKKILPRQTASYLKFKKTIIKASLLNKINRNNLTSFFFNPYIFYFLIIVLFLINCSVFILLAKEKSFVIKTTPLIIAILVLVHLIHEFGHAISSRNQNIKCGNIGIGFYYIIPIFFIDLSDSWNISLRKRIIINLSGIFIEYIICIFFYVLFIISKNDFFLAIPILIFIKSFYNLNPLFKSDMYWVISDLLKSPNLNEDAICLFRETIKNKTKIQRRNIILFLYGLLIHVFWVYIIYGFVKRFWFSIVNFGEGMKKIKNNIESDSFSYALNLDLVISIVYVFFFIFIIYQFFKKKIR